MHRRRIALYGILAACIAITVVGVTLNGQRLSANAVDDGDFRTTTEGHPPIFDFEATRTVHSAVVFSGRFEVWNDVDQRYAPGSGLVAVDIQDGSSWSMIGAYPTDASGQFSGSERIPGAYPVRARATDAANRDLGTSLSVMLPFAQRSKLVWTGVTAVRSGGTTTVSGDVYGVWARDPVSHDVDYLGRYGESMAVQARVQGRWTTLGHVGTNGDSSFAFTAGSHGATAYRVVAPKSPFYTGSTKTVHVRAAG